MVIVELGQRFALVIYKALDTELNAVYMLGSEGIKCYSYVWDWNGVCFNIAGNM